MRRASVTSVLAAALLVVACGGQTDPEGPDDMERRAELRETLRAELGAAYDTPVDDGSPAQLRKGGQLYEQLCRACHGAGGKGNGPSANWLRPRPASLVAPSSATYFSDRAQLDIIEHGVPGTAMVGWAEVLDETDRLNVFLYVRSMRAAD